MLQNICVRKIGLRLQNVTQLGLQIRNWIIITDYCYLLGNTGPNWYSPSGITHNVEPIKYAKNNTEQIFDAILTLVVDRDVLIARSIYYVTVSLSLPGWNDSIIGIAEIFISSTPSNLHYIAFKCKWPNLVCMMQWQSRRSSLARSWKILMDCNKKESQFTFTFIHPRTLYIAELA